MLKRKTPRNNRSRPEVKKNLDIFVVYVSTVEMRNGEIF
jgi:hypothetical protein